MKFGSTVREIRLSKNISLKACYYNIVVKSFAIRFEKGEVNLNITDFLEVLNNIAVTPEEFFFIHFKGRNQFIGGLLQENISKIFSGKFNEKEAKEIYLTYRQSYKNEDKLLAYLSHFYLQYMISNNHHLPSSEEDFIVNYFNENESWSLVETLIFPSCPILFPKELREILMNRCLKTINKYKNYINLEYQEYFAQSLANYIFLNFSFGDSDSALVFLPTLKRHIEEFPLVKGNFWIRIQLDLFEALAANYDKNQNLAKEKLQHLKEKCAVMGFSSVGDSYLEKYKEISKKSGKENVVTFP